MEYKPHNYQAYCIQRIVQDPAVGLFLRPGLGKTSITLTAVNILRYFYWQVTRVLVIAPKKVAEATWSKEAAKWDHLRHLRFSLVLGSAAQRIRAVNTPADVYVVNRENMPWLVDHYRQAWPFDMVVCDESTSFKNSASKRFKAFRLIRRFCKKVVLLTGTPASRGLIDLWAQVYLLDEGQRLGRTLGQYRERYFTALTHGGHFTEYKPQSGAEAAALEAIGDICVSMKAEDYLDLPECVENEIPVTLDDRAKREYDSFERSLLLEIDGDVVTAQGAAVLTGKLLQFCNGAVYDDKKQALRVHDCKLDAYIELLEQIGGEPCMTFYGYRHDLDRLLERLKKTALRVRVYKGPEDEEDWNAGRIDVLLTHPASCAYGLNLQAGGRHVIWFGLNWSFELNDQGKCRLWRQGSAFDKVYVHYLVAQGCVDEDVMTAVRERAGTHEAVMGALKARIKKVREEIGYANESAAS
jgi:SNF2 family DNA or RNA helicase